MKIIISESQAESFLHTMLDHEFNGSKMKFEGDGRNIYVDGRLMMIVYPTSAIIDKSILDKVNETLYYENMKDLKDEIRSWININFGIRKTAEKLLGIQFKKLSEDNKSLMEVNEENLDQYSQSVHNVIKRIVSKLSLPYVDKIDIIWDKDRYKYVIKLQYDIEKDEAYDVIDSNEDKVRSITKFLDLPKSSLFVGSYYMLNT